MKIWCCFKIRVLSLKNGRYTPNSCPTTWGAIVGSGNCLVVFHNLSFPFQPLFKVTKISLKFMFTPALTAGHMYTKMQCKMAHFTNRKSSHYISEVARTVDDLPKTSNVEFNCHFLMVDKNTYL